MNFVHKVLLLILLILVATSGFALVDTANFGFVGTESKNVRILKVTSLNDSGPGTLRDAINQSGPRIIIFSVGGAIKLRTPLVIRNGSVRISGQTAPGDGIVLFNSFIQVNGAKNVLIQFLRIRPGDALKKAVDGLVVINSEKVTIDHCSVSWSNDEGISLYNNREALVQWSLIGEVLQYSSHDKGKHSMGAIVGGHDSIFRYSILAHNHTRMPRFSGPASTRIPKSEKMEFYGNTVYNWSGVACYGGEDGQINFHSNYYIAGPATRHARADRLLQPTDETTSRWTISDNFFDDGNLIRGNSEFLKLFKNASVVTVANKLSLGDIQTLSFTVLDNSGARLPRRDATDTRILSNISARSATVGLGNRGIINSQDDVGGYPEYRSGNLPLDEDGDSLPDGWERIKGLDPKVMDSISGPLIDGILPIEAYLNDYKYIKNTFTGL